MPSFDTVCEPNLVEVKNAVDQVTKEVGTRFDFKGTSAGIELKDKEITLFGDADFQLAQVEDAVRNFAGFGDSRARVLTPEFTPASLPPPRR